MYAFVAVAVRGQARNGNFANWPAAFAGPSAQGEHGVQEASLERLLTVFERPF